MTAAIACSIAALSAAGFLALWLTTAHRELTERRSNLIGLWDQLMLHQRASALAGDGPERELAARMLATNQRIYREAAAAYNKLLKTPRNRIPALLLGFRPVDLRTYSKRKQGEDYDLRL